jgi:hypothetical protein
MENNIITEANFTKEDLLKTNLKDLHFLNYTIDTTPEVMGMDFLIWLSTVADQPWADVITFFEGNNDPAIDAMGARVVDGYVKYCNEHPIDTFDSEEEF